jgi:hypothetical protein
VLDNVDLEEQLEDVLERPDVDEVIEVDDELEYADLTDDELQDVEEEEEHDEVVSFDGLGGTIGCDAASFSTSSFSTTSSVVDSPSVTAFKYTVLLFTFVACNVA